MTDLWDYESRWETTTRTDDGCYDQVLALSQGVINTNFAELHKLYKDELGKISLSDAAIGSFEGTVDAPRVLILGADQPEATLNEVLFQIRFTSGSLKDNQGKAAIPDLNHWVFSVRAPIVPENLGDPNDIEDPEDREKLEKKIKRIKERFDYPGDYSVSRLYVKLSAAKWGSLDWSRSFAGLDENGKPLPYLNWSLRSANKSTALRLKLFLELWADKLDDDSRNSLGLTFKSPTEIKIPRKFVPIEGVHQPHQYKSKKNGAEKGQTGFTGAGNCNCLLYLEMVQGGGQRPKDPRLIWSGNFATQDGGPDHPPITATYLLSREIFFEKIILPEFRALNQASDVYYDPVGFHFANGHNNVILNWRIGSDPNYPLADCGAYDFEARADPENPSKVSHYEWNKQNQQNKDGPYVGKLRYGGAWGRISTNVVMQSKVTWTPGSTTIKLEGTTTINENVEWGRDPNHWENAWSHIFDRYVVKWSLDVSIVARLEKFEDTEVMVSYLDFDVPKSVGATVTPHFDRDNVEMDKHDVKLLEDLEDRMAKQLDRVVGNIRQRLKVSGRFTYPGNGKLQFEEPGIGRFGELNAQVKFVPLGREDWIIVPPSNPTKPTPPVIVEPVPKNGRPIIANHQLTWTTNSMSALSPDQTLKIRAVNDGADKVYYAANSINFRTGKRQSGLFLDTEFVLKPKTSSRTVEVSSLSGEGSDGGAETGSTAVDSPSKAKGVVELVVGEEQPECQVEISKLGTERGLTSWQLQISTESSQTLALAPGGWFEVSITGNSGLAGEQEVMIVEFVRDAENKDIGHLAKPYQVLVS